MFIFLETNVYYVSVLYLAWYIISELSYHVIQYTPHSCIILPYMCHGRQGVQEEGSVKVLLSKITQLCVQEIIPTFRERGHIMWSSNRKNPWKSRHPLFWIHRVYGIQNDRLNLTINEFLKIWKTMHHSKRYSYFFGFFFSWHGNISSPKNLLILRLRRSFWIP